MKELDTVKLIENYEGIVSGTVGVIVHKYDGKTFEVEFFDREGHTIDVVTTPGSMLTLVESYGSGK